MTQRWWMHFPLCPWAWRQGVAPARALHIAGTWRGNPPFGIVALAMAFAIAIDVAIFDVVTNFVAFTVAFTHCHYHPAAISVALLSAIAVTVTVALAIDHCHLCHHWLLRLPSPLAITVTVAVSHFRELLPWHNKNCIWPIEAKNAHLMLFCSDSGRRIDQSQMTDQVSSGNSQHQLWMARGKQWTASEESGWHQGGSRGAAGWRHWLIMGGVVLLCFWIISHWQIAFVMMC